MEQAGAGILHLAVGALLDVLAVHDLVGVALHAIAAEHNALIRQQPVVDLQDTVQLHIVHLGGDVGLTPRIVPNPVVGVPVYAGHQVQALHNVGVVGAVDLFPVLDHAVPRAAEAGGQHGGALTVEELVVGLVGGGQGDVGLNGALFVHIPQQLPGGQGVIAQVFAGKVGGHIGAVAVVHPAEGVAAHHGRRHTVGKEHTYGVIGTAGRHALDVLALGVSLNDSLDHGAELIPVGGFLGDAGLLGQIPAVDDGAVLDGLRLLGVGLAENAVHFVAHHAGVRLGAVQVLCQVGIGRQVLGDLMQQAVVGPLGEGGRGAHVAGEQVGQRIAAGPQLVFLAVVVPGDVHRFKSHIEFLLNGLQYRVGLPAGQGRFHVPVAHGDGEVFVIALGGLGRAGVRCVRRRGRGRCRAAAAGQQRRQQGRAKAQ